MRLKFVHGVLFAVIALFISACDSTNDLKEVVTGATKINITLSGDQVIPAQTTDATATATLTVSGLGVLTGSVTVAGLASGNVVNSIHLHLGVPGTSGAPIFTFEQDATNTAIWNIPANQTFSAAELISYLAGGTYLNVHTTLASNGELRGQVLPKNYEIVITMLTGEQQVAEAVTTTMTGKAYSLVNTSTGKLVTNLLINDATNVQSAHIHKADPGIAVSTGVKELVANSTDSNIYEARTVLSSADKLAYTEAGLYINVHTGDNPAGELRGQILPTGYEVVVTELSGDNVLPSGVNTDLTARAFTLFNTTTDVMKVNVNVSNASDVSNMHVHLGAADESGGVVGLGLTENDIDTNLYEETITLDSTETEDYLAGGLYINVHTNAYPSGELRGQIEP